jgi:hypothetical protein
VPAWEELGFIWELSGVFLVEESPLTLVSGFIDLDNVFGLYVPHRGKLVVLQDGVLMPCVMCIFFL